MYDPRTMATVSATKMERKLFIVIAGHLTAKRQSWNEKRSPRCNRRVAIAERRAAALVLNPIS
jgi:hypothetical protein